MKYQALLEKYQQRNKGALVDGIMTGLSYADELSIDLGLMEDTGIFTQAMETLSVGLPFAVIAVTEGYRVVFGRKTHRAALQDAGYRMVKTAAGLGAGAAVVMAGLGVMPAIPVAIGARMMLEKYRSRMLTAYRVKQRIERLRALRDARRDNNILISPVQFTLA